MGNFENPNLDPKPKPSVLDKGLVFDKTLFKQKEQPVTGLNAEPQTYRSGNAGSMAPGYDVERYQKFLPDQAISPLTRDIDLERARSQSNWGQAGNMLLTVGANIIPGLMEGIASIVDLPDYFTLNNQVDNDVTKAIEEYRNKVSEAFPIYRENPGKSLDLGDPAWWFDNGSSLIESMTGFAALGFGTGALLSGLSKMGKAGEIAATLMSSAALTQAESMQDAMGTYKTVLDRELDKGTDYQNAHTIASHAAATVVKVDRINMVSNLTSANLFLKKPLGTRIKLEAPKNYAQSLMEGAKEGLQEYSEENVNFIAQQAGQSEKPYTLDDARNDVMSKQGLEAGLLGFIGGVGQTMATHVVNNLSGKTKEERERYLKQVNQINEFEGMLKENDLTTMSDLFMNQQQLDQLHKNVELADENASKSGNWTDSINARRQLVSFQASKAFQSGTTDNLLETYEKVKNLTPEEAQAKGLDTDETSDFHYQKRADEAIDTIEKLEKQYNTLKLGKYLNVDNIIANRSDAIATNKEIEKADKELLELRQNTDPALYDELAQPLKDKRDKLNQKLKDQAKEFKYLISKEAQGKILEKMQAQAAAKKEGENAVKKEDIKQNPEDYERGNLEPEEQDVHDEAKNGEATGTTEEIKSPVSDAPATKKEKPIKAKFSDDNLMDNTITEVTGVPPDEEFVPPPPEYDNSIQEVTGEDPDSKPVVEKPVAEKPVVTKPVYDNSIQEVVGTPEVFKEGAQDPGAPMPGKPAEEKDFKAMGAEKKAISNFVEKQKDKKDFQKQIENRRKNIMSKNWTAATKKELLQHLNDEYKKVTGEDLPNLSKETSKRIADEKKVNEIAAGSAEKNQLVKEDNKNTRVRAKSINTRETGLNSIGYMQIERDEVTVNQQYVNLTHPAKFHSGTPLTIELADDPSIPMMHNGKKTTWGEVKPTLKNHDDMVSKIPIRILSEGEQVGFIHEGDWKPDGWNGDEVVFEKDKKDLLKLREKIFNEKTLDTTVQRKAIGEVKVNKNGTQKKVKDLPKDSKRKYVVADQNFVDNLPDKMAYEGSNPVYGQTYLSFVVSEQKGEIPTRLTYGTQNVKLSQNKTLGDTIYNTIYYAVNMYDRTKRKLLPKKSEETIVAIKKSTKLDIRAISDLKAYVSQFVQLVDLEKKEKLTDRATKYTSPELHLVSITPSGFEVYSRKPGQETKYAFFSFIVDTKQNDAYRKATFELLSDMRYDLYTHVSSAALKKNAPLIGMTIEGNPTTLYSTYTDYIEDNLTTDLDPTVFQDGTVGYTVQNRIYINNPATETKVEEKPQVKEEVKPIVESNEKIVSGLENIVKELTPEEQAKEAKRQATIAKLRAGKKKNFDYQDSSAVEVSDTGTVVNAGHAWETYKEKIQEKNKDMQFSDFAQLSNEERQRLIDCL
jgi:hypothetical protein